MEVLLGQRCPRKEDPVYLHAMYEDEIAWRESVYVCSTRRSLGMKGEYNCADCNFPPPLFVRENNGIVNHHIRCPTDHR